MYVDPTLTDYRVVQILRQDLGWTWLQGGPRGSGAKMVSRIRIKVLLYTIKKGSVTDRLGRRAGVAQTQVFGRIILQKLRCIAEGAGVKGAFV
eukprot:g6851.t1